MSSSADFRPAPIPSRNSSARRRLAAVSVAAVSVAAVCLAAALPLSAQDPPRVAPEGYGRWENLGPALLSPHGDWVAYTVSRVDETAELRVRRLSEDATRVFPWGRSPRFSPDGGWLAWTVGLSPDETERREEEGDALREGAALLDLATGDMREFASVSGWSFDSSGRFLALRADPPEEPAGKGADLRIVVLATGSETSFGNVGEMAWSSSGSRIAMVIATGTDLGNGVQVYDAGSGTLQSVDASGAGYRGLAWRDDAADLAALRSREDASAGGSAYDVLAWRGLDRGPEMVVLGEGAAGIANGLEVVDRAPQWSDEGAIISIGLRSREEEDAQDAGATGTSEADADETGSADSQDDQPDLPGLQIWHSRDLRIFPQRQAAEGRDANRTLLAVWHLDENRVVTIGSDLMADATLLHGWGFALEDIAEPYPFGAMFGRPYHDVWSIDVDSGERRRLLTRVRYEWPGAGGRWLVSYDGANYWSLEVATAERHDLTSNLATSFANTEYDTPTDVVPPFAFGPGGWLEDDAGVLLYDKHDIWRVALDGSGATRLTAGAEAGITHRVASLPDDDIPGLDPGASLHLTLYNERTEQRGYARVAPGWDGPVETLVFEDALVGGLARADSADILLYRAEAFDDPPDYFVGGPDLADAVQVTDINPFIAEVAWGRAELVDFTSESGRDLQAVLLYPAGYEAGTAVPTIVYTYEMLSPQMHRFIAPSERDYYNFTAWTQHGYAVLLPDIVYRARDPGVSALESVRAAVARVVDMGVADPDAVGLIGHSWGGYQATFLPTRTDIFAASVAGAPLTDFVSFMGAIHWNPGIPEVDHWETGQARMEVPFWEDPEAHRRNSPIHEVHNLETPLLMAFGDDDGVVDWDQGTEFYNFARRAGKQMVLLVYEGEDHGLREEANQKDYHRRILEWFGHYLKGDPAPSWITDGVSLQDLEDEKRRVAGGGKRAGGTS
ncbi:MAG: prolyl oligopeptidase family serine peptidase [Gammaproteobacteria bacterium]|nr:prolyl oligopeptidase family serine peptidase [Gammaproteobacteria bacterium]MDE0259268.1 prolyl oligopeptidase family serine peptidase [Gammaproteobacteria bacterium]